MGHVYKVAGLRCFIYRGELGELSSPSDYNKNIMEKFINITPTQLLMAFTARYSPYLLKGFSFPERKPEDVPIDEHHPELYAIAHSVDLKRKEYPFIGAKLAVLGSVGGCECVNDIMNTLHSIVNDNSSNKNMEKAVAGLLGILIVETTRHTEEV